MSDNIELMPIEDNETTRLYFNRFAHIVKTLAKMSENELSKSKSSVEDAIILTHLLKLENSIKALQTKYMFNGLVNHRQASQFYIDTIDSGFPLEKEIRGLMADKQRAKEKLEELPGESSIKQGIIDYALGSRAVNTELQYDLSQRKYFEMIQDLDLFEAVNKPDFIKLKDSASGNKRYLVHWSVYDIKKNHPNIYSMLIEYSGKTEILEDEIAEKFSSHLMNNSASTLKLLVIAAGIDTEFAEIHPKCLKRVHVGPVYKNGITKHNDAVQSVLNQTKDQKNNWVFAWSIETLLSQGSKRVKKSFFGDQQEEIYSINSGSHEAFEAGATEINRSVILPYEAFQALVDAPENPLNEFKKYVVNDSGEVLYL